MTVFVFKKEARKDSLTAILLIYINDDPKINQIHMTEQDC